MTILDFNNLGLLKTGQTTDYTPSGYTCKDDGGEQRGETKRYTVLSTGQYSGTTNITVNAKTDARSNNCVIDNITGLMYGRTSPASVGPASNGLLYWDDTAVNNEDIFAYCDAANTANFAGHNDWRVANRIEVSALMNVDAGSAPRVDQVAFPSISIGSIWVSTTYPVSTSSAYAFSYSSLNSFTAVKTSATASHILVRGDRV